MASRAERTGWCVKLERAPRYDQCAARIGGRAVGRGGIFEYAIVNLAGLRPSDHEVAASARLMLRRRHAVSRP